MKGGIFICQRRKNGKSAKNKEKIIKNQIENIEKSMDSIEKIQKEQKELQEKEDARKKQIEEKAELIKEDLQNQLETQGKFGKYFDDLIDDYIFFVKLKEDLQYDIKIKGLRYDCMTGNGYTTEKTNESVQNLLKVNGQMLKILQDLDLKAPSEDGEGDDLL